MKKLSIILLFLVLVCAKVLPAMDLAAVLTPDILGRSKILFASTESDSLSVLIIHNKLLFIPIFYITCKHRISN